MCAGPPTAAAAAAAAHQPAAAAGASPRCPHRCERAQRRLSLQPASRPPAAGQESFKQWSDCGGGQRRARQDGDAGVQLSGGNEVLLPTVRREKVRRQFMI